MNDQPPPREVRRRSLLQAMAYGAPVVVGGAGMIRLYNFDLVRNVIDVETFSPWLLSRDPEDRTPLEAENLELTGPVDRFSLQIDFDRRFQGFAPRTPPAPRPAGAVTPRGTEAYWRFDASGFAGAGSDGAAVAAGAVVRDLTGRGNDLTVQRLHGSAAEVLTWSADHHEGQPAHASLRFDGGKNPDRGAILVRVEVRAGLLRLGRRRPHHVARAEAPRVPDPVRLTGACIVWPGTLACCSRTKRPDETAGPVEPGPVALAISCGDGEGCFTAAVGAGRA